MRSRSKLVVRLQLALEQNRLALIFVAAWLTVSFLVSVKIFGLAPTRALLVVSCIDKNVTGWGHVYQAVTEVGVFGALASLVLTNVTRRYRPELTSRRLAERCSDHVVVIGFTNFGKRVWELATLSKRSSVIVEEDPARVAALVHEEEPVVLGDPRDRLTLSAAAVERARVVVIAVDDLETAAIACRIVRELNSDCELVVRAADEDVGALLERTYRARALSTSKTAASLIEGIALKARAARALVLGHNNVGLRVREALEHKRIAVTHLDGAPSLAELQVQSAHADLIVLAEDDLGKDLVTVERIRRVNKRAKIICRAFHEDAAQILTHTPFDCVVVSTSRHAAEALARTGVFRGLGIDDGAALKTRRELAASS